MKNQYVGDIRDFEKYAVLNALSAASGLSVVLCWMLTPNDAGQDGRKLKYLERPDDYRHLNADVFDRLSKVINDNQRSVEAIRTAQVIADATYYEPVLADSLTARASYMNGLWGIAETPSLMCFDPDNGIEVASVRKGNKRSSKYIYLDELADAYARGHSLVVFHHWGRYKKDEYLDDMLPRLKTTCGLNHDPFAIYSSGAAFVILAQSEHNAQLATAGETLTDQWAPKLTHR